MRGLDSRTAEIFAEIEYLITWSIIARTSADRKTAVTCSGEKGT